MIYEDIFWIGVVCFAALLAGVYIKYMLGKYAEKLNLHLKTIDEKLNDMLQSDTFNNHASQQVQRMNNIVEMLGNNVDSGTFEKHIADQDRKLSAISGKLDDIEKSAVKAETIGKYLIHANENLERILWMFRFDEEKYEQDLAAERRQAMKPVPDQRGISHNATNVPTAETTTAHPGASEPVDESGASTSEKSETVSGDTNTIFEQCLSDKEAKEVHKLKTVLDESRSRYGAIMEYMRLSGKGGSEALELLKHAEGSEKDNSAIL